MFCSKFNHFHRKPGFSMFLVKNWTKCVQILHFVIFYEKYQLYRKTFGNKVKEHKKCKILVGFRGLYLNWFKSYGPKQASDGAPWSQNWPVVAKNGNFEDTHQNLAFFMLFHFVPKSFSVKLILFIKMTKCNIWTLFVQFLKKTLKKAVFCGNG